MLKAQCGQCERLQFEGKDGKDLMFYCLDCGRVHVVSRSAYNSLRNQRRITEWWRTH